MLCLFNEKSVVFFMTREQVQAVEDMTETLQARMGEINEINDSLGRALQQNNGIDEDFESLEAELNSILDEV